MQRAIAMDSGFHRARIFLGYGSVARQISVSDRRGRACHENVEVLGLAPLLGGGAFLVPT